MVTWSEGCDDEVEVTLVVLIQPSSPEIGNRSAS